MNKALSQVSKSPFTRRIVGCKLPQRFHQPTFLLYNGRSDPVEHVSQFNQRMAVHLKDEALLCKIFPSSLGPVAMRWFNELKANSINSSGNSPNLLVLVLSRVVRYLDPWIRYYPYPCERVKP